MLKAKLLEWLTFTGNVTNTPVAEFFNSAAIPLAPRQTAFTDLTARFPLGPLRERDYAFRGPALRRRGTDPDRPRVHARRHRRPLPLQPAWRRALDAFLTIENLFNVEWRETQFYYTSRLPGEPPQGVNDIHYTPGNPRTFLGGLAFRF